MSVEGIEDASMLTLIGNVLQGLLIFIMFVGLMVLSYSMSTTRTTKEDTPTEIAKRLWAKYRATAARTLASPWFWAAAGLVTAALLFFNPPIFIGP
jgi:hypothetical protein